MDVYARENTVNTKSLHNSDGHRVLLRGGGVQYHSDVIKKFKVKRANLSHFT
jgi:hypothetical protein